MAETGQSIEDLINAALKRVRGATGSSAELFDECLDFLNQDVLPELLLENKWSWNRKEASLTTTASTRTVALPADALEVRSIQTTVSNEERDLDLYTEDEARSLYPNPTDEGSPEGYIEDVYDASTTSAPPIKQIAIVPTPDIVYTLRVSYSYSFNLYETADVAEFLPVPQYAYPWLRQKLYTHILDFLKNPKSEIDRAEGKAALLMLRMKQKNAGTNKGTLQIRAPLAVRRYRRVRYEV